MRVGLTMVEPIDSPPCTNHKSQNAEQRERERGRSQDVLRVVRRFVGAVQNVRVL